MAADEDAAAAAADERRDEVMVGRSHRSSFTSVRPLIRSDSATLRNAVSLSWSTETSPLYMKSKSDRMSA